MKKLVSLFLVIVMLLSMAILPAEARPQTVLNSAGTMSADLPLNDEEVHQSVTGDITEDEEFRCVRFTALGDDPYAYFPFSSAGNNDTIDPDNVTWAAIRYKTGSRYDSSGAEYTAQFYISPEREPCIPVSYNFTGNWETVIVDMTSVSNTTFYESRWNSEYYTATDSIRFDPLESDRDPVSQISYGQVNEGDYIDIAWIAFFENEEDAIAYSGKEDTPYCLLDTESFLNSVDDEFNFETEHNIKIELYDSNGIPVQTNDDPDQPEDETFQYVRFTALGNDPYAFFPFSSAGNNNTIDPDKVTHAAIRYRTASQYDSTGVEYTAQLYIVPDREPCIPVIYNHTGSWETAIVDMTSVSDITKLESKWSSEYYTMTDRIRFDPLESDRDPEEDPYARSEAQVIEGDYIDIAWIAFFENEEDATAYTGKEDTPYCLLDTDSFMGKINDWGMYEERNIKVELYDSNGDPVQTTNDPDQPEDPPTGDTFQYVRFTALGIDPHACFQFSSAGNNDTIDPDNVTWAAIRYRTGSQYDSTGVEYIAQFYIVPSTRPFIPVTYNFTGNWETVIVDMTSVSSITELESKWNSDYYTETDSIRFDPLEPDRDSEQYIISGQDVSEGDYIDVAWIAFFENEEDAIAYTGEEDTPYCLLDTDSLMNLSGEYNLKADLYDSNGNPVQTNDDPDQPEDPPTDPNLRVAACNLSFADSIYIKYAISADDLAGIQLLIWTEPQSEYVYGTQDALLTTIGTETINGTQCAVFQYSKLAAKQMVDNIYARAFVELNGNRFYSEVKKYSVLQYAYNKTGRTGTASSNPKLITLLNDMLQYGASAQQYLNYKTGRLATMNYYQVKVVGGVLSDMCDSGLYLAGENVVLTAFDTNSEGLPFACWQDSEGNIVGTSIAITVTVDMSNEIYTAKYGSFSDYSMFEYESNGDGTCTITVLNAHDSTDIVLPDRAPNGDVVTGIGVGAFAGEDITSVTIPISVTSIGKNAFKGCDELTDVYYAGTLAQWDAIAIAAGNEPLLTAELHCAADGSEGLAYEDNGDGTCTITGIGTCTDADVIIPNEIDGLRVTKIGYCAFYYNTKITSIKLPENVVTVEGSAFRQCENLKNATILNCDVRIGEEAFAYGGLSDIYFNGTYEQWDYAVLPSQSYSFIYYNCYPNNVKIHTINTESIGLSYEDNGDGTCTITGIGGCSDTDVYIPWYIGEFRVTAIGDRAFENQSGLTEIHIPNSVKSIGTRAFYGCTGLTEMAIPRSVTSIGTQIFYKANNIHTVYYNADYWPDGTENQFLNNSSIKKVVFGGYRVGGDSSDNSVVSRSLGLTRNVELIELLDSVTVIGWRAFIDCTNLTSITIPYSVRKIYDAVFSGCVSLKNVYYNGTISDWCRITMDSNNWSPCTNPCINGASLFIDGELLTDAIIPDDITSIGWSAFAGCTSLTSITIPDSVASIGEYAFYGCTSLTSITIPDGETSIRFAAFAGCTSLTSITIPDSVTSIQRQAFYNCTSITSITIPDSVTSIDQEAFYNCASLRDIYYDGTVEQWENVSKDYSWASSSPVSVVHCLDGDAPI